jgi:hypothetical protein
MFVAAAEIGADGIDDDQPAIRHGIKKVAQSGNVAGEREGAGKIFGVVARDGGDAEDAVAIGAERFEARPDGVGEVVFGSEEEDGGGRIGE